MRKDDRLLEIDRLEREIQQRRVILSKSGNVLTPIERKAQAEIEALTKQLNKLQAVQPRLF